MNKFLFTDTNGKKSLTATAFILGFAIVNLKLIFSGMTIAGLNLAVFAGSEYAMCVASLGGIYILRKHTKKPEESRNVSQTE